MELMYPIAIIICVVLSLVLLFMHPKKKVKYTNGKKVANTKYIKETEYYKEKVKKYKIISNIIKIISAVCIIVTSILIARPVTIQTKSEDKFNRDIFICLDVSTSVAEANYEIVKKFKNILSDIEGDRIGIVIFNTAPVVTCTLTDDYEYVKECLDKIEKQLAIEAQDQKLFDEVIETGDYDKYYNATKDPEEDYAVLYGGTGTNAKEKGSSLIGDGLAGAVFSFPNLKTDKERTRIILFSTDNDLQGYETVTLSEACTLCNDYKINLYAYCAINKYSSEQKVESYKIAVEQNAKGKIYKGDLDKTTTNMVKEIKDTKKTLLKTSKKTYAIDHPTIPIITIIISFFILIIIEKRIKI